MLEKLTVQGPFHQHLFLKTGTKFLAHIFGMMLWQILGQNVGEIDQQFFSCSPATFSLTNKSLVKSTFFVRKCFFRQNVTREKLVTFWRKKHFRTKKRARKMLMKLTVSSRCYISSKLAGVPSIHISIKSCGKNVKKKEEYVSISPTYFCLNF